MKRELNPELTAAVIILALAGGFGGYRLYELYYLSSDLRRTLTAAMDPTATDADILSYIRNARLQVRTTRDEETLQKFQKFVQLAKDSIEINARLFNETLSTSSSLAPGDTLFDKLIEIRSQYWREHIPVPKSLTAQIDQALEDMKAKRKSDDELRNAEERRAKDEANAAKALYKEVCAELGCPFQKRSASPNDALTPTSSTTH